MHQTQCDSVQVRRRRSVAVALWPPDHFRRVCKLTATKPDDVHSDEQWSAMMKCRSQLEVEQEI